MTMQEHGVIGGLHQKPTPKISAIPGALQQQLVQGGSMHRKTPLKPPQQGCGEGEGAERGRYQHSADAE